MLVVGREIGLCPPFARLAMVEVEAGRVEGSGGPGGVDSRPSPHPPRRSLADIILSLGGRPENVRERGRGKGKQRRGEEGGDGRKSEFTTPTSHFSRHFSRLEVRANLTSLAGDIGHEEMRRGSCDKGDGWRRTTGGERQHENDGRHVERQRPKDVRQIR